MVDRQNRAGHKGGAPSTDQEMAMDRRERLRKLAMETIDLSKDPYFMPNHLGSYECKLCLTLHTNEGSYLAHTQGKKHQVNLARRAQKEKEQQQFGVAPAPKTQKTGGPRKTIKIGRPGYRVTKCREPITKQKALLFENRGSRCAQDTRDVHVRAEGRKSGPHTSVSPCRRRTLRNDLLQGS
eukprot:GEMP01020242.1.p1 GENE.GEMP01020242.1~~GEMP01020242.1.p1  ORF type:complete len:182 (+),score=42.70 GEMP01020242.1:42-587(+)